MCAWDPMADPRARARRGLDPPLLPPPQHNTHARPTACADSPAPVPASRRRRRDRWWWCGGAPIQAGRQAPRRLLGPARSTPPPLLQPASQPASGSPRLWDVCVVGWWDRRGIQGQTGGGLVWAHARALHPIAHMHAASLASRRLATARESDATTTRGETRRRNESSSGRFPASSSLFCCCCCPFLLPLVDSACLGGRDCACPIAFASIGPAGLFSISIDRSELLNGRPMTQFRPIIA